jgi:hypothetical protein
MSQVLCTSLASNFQNSVQLVAETIGQFKADQWTEGVDAFQVPWKIAYHIIESLDYYFRDPGAEPFRWGHRFQGAWWVLPEDRAPAPELLLGYLAEIEGRIAQHFRALDDSQLATPYDEKRELGATRLGHYAYALRHTMHHHGALSLLSLMAGNPEGSWM